MSTTHKNSGIDDKTAIFDSLRPPLHPFPSPQTPLSLTSYLFSLLPSPKPLKTAILDASNSSSLSYIDLETQVHQLTNSLHSFIPQGSVAFVIAPNLIQVPVLVLALLSIGAIVSPANPTATAAELSQLIELSKPSVAFATDEAASKLPSYIKTIVVDSAEFQSLYINNQEVLKPAVKVDVKQEDPAVILYSSGTTGRLKAACLSHKTMIARVAVFTTEAKLIRLERRGNKRRKDNEIVVLGAPFFHSMGLLTMLTLLGLGVMIVVMGKTRGVMEIVRVAERYGATQIMTATPVVVAMAKLEEMKEIELKELEVVFCGGSPVPENLWREFGERFPNVDLYQGYGLTEGGRIAVMVDYEESCNVRSVGRLSASLQAKIVDNVTYEALSVGQIGELCVRGPTIMSGYIGDDEANALAFDSNGWLRTGDLCYFDQDGFLYIVGRLKEVIKYKGYQVPPAELEYLLRLLPGIVDVAVIPYPDEEVGQIPTACIVRQQGSNLTEVGVMEFVAKQVAPYKKIRKVVFVESVPRSSAGKILRQELLSIVVPSS